MGKSNRIRINRANEKMKAPETKQKKQVPSWVLSLITIVCALALVLGVVAGLMTSNGVFVRMRTAAKTDNYRVSGTMMSYFFWTTFDNFVSENESYMEYYSLNVDENATRAAQAEALRSQNFGAKLADGTESMDSVMLGSFTGTWFDYIAAEAKANVQEILVYCEEADRRNLELTETDKTQINTNLSNIEMIAQIYGYTTSSYLSASYGDGVNTSDARKAMELDYLSARCKETIKKEYIAAILDTEITDRYNSDKKTYDMIDYSYYDFSVKYTDAAKIALGADYTSTELKADETGEKKVLAQYKMMIAEAKANATTLAAITEEEAFEAFVMDYICNKYFETVYGEAEFAADDKETMATAKDSVKAEILKLIKEEIKAGQSETTETEYKDGKIFGATVSEACAKVLQEVKHDVFDDVYADTLAYFRSKIGYVKDDEFSEWAFAGDKTAGMTKTKLTGDGSKEEIADTTDPANLDKSFSAKAYLLTKAPYADSDKTRDVAYMVFSSEDVAKKAIAALAGTTPMTYEAFEQAFNGLADKGETDIVTKVENYTKGTIGSSAFDNWFFDEKREAGTYTDKPQTLESGGYGVFFYMGEGDEQWIVDIRDEIAEERMEAGFKTLATTFPVTFKDKAIAKIGK